MKISARFLVLFLFLASFLFLFTKHSFAQTSAVTKVSSGIPTQAVSGQYAPNFDSNVPVDQHSYIQSVVIEVMSSMICQLSGTDPIRKDQKCLGMNSKTGKIGFVEGGGGAIGAMGHFIALTFTPPLSTSDYTHYLSSNFGFAKKTYAATNNCVDSPQGVGFCGISPIIDIWVAMRNIAYLLFVLIFVLIGLAIIFRVHIDPRTVMTIENQIPRIIVGILLVTFSFAIAGFLIDVMYVAIYLVGGVLAGAAPAAGTSIDVNAVATSPTPFDAINRLWPGNPGDPTNGGGFGALAKSGYDTIYNLTTNVLAGDSANTHPDILALLLHLVESLTGILIGILAGLIILLALIYTCIRLWIILVVAYISILLDVIFAPFWFLIGLLPGSSSGPGAWFKDMLANLAVFPTAVAMFILANVFYQIAGLPQNAANPSLFLPPLVGGGLGAGGADNVFAGIVALGFLFMTPNVLQITRNAIKAPNLNYGPVFQPVAGAAAIYGGTGREVGGTLASSREAVINPDTGAWERRRVGRAFVGRLFGGR